MDISPATRQHWQRHTRSPLIRFWCGRLKRWMTVEEWWLTRTREELIDPEAWEKYERERDERLRQENVKRMAGGTRGKKYVKQDRLRLSDSYGTKASQQAEDFDLAA